MLRNNVKTIREALKLSQLQFANALNMPLEAIEMIESERAHIDIDFCFQVLDLAKRKNFHINLIDVLYKKEDRR